MKPDPEKVKKDLVDKTTSALGKCNQLTREEVELVKRLLEAYKGWLFVGKLGKIGVFILTTIAGALVAYEQVLKSVKAWFLGS